MNAANGHIELDRSVVSITIGQRHRADLGDIDTLAASIKRDGLLQPITVTPDGVLVCGARRLAAVRQLGWRTLNVWVRSGISGRLGYLLAEQDDNALHKPFTQLEAAALYRELKELLAEDAARREAANQFSATHQPRWNGSAESAEPLTTPRGDARRQAAAMITGGSSYTRLEEIGFLQRLADDVTQPDTFREQVRADLAAINAGSPVHPAFERTRALLDAAQSEHGEELNRLALAALDRIKQQPKNKKRPSRPATDSDHDQERWPVRAFVLTWGELDGWTAHFDAVDLARDLTAEETERFFAAVAETVRFAEQLRTAIADTEAANMLHGEESEASSENRPRLHAV